MRSRHKRVDSYRRRVSTSVKNTNRRLPPVSKRVSFSSPSYTPRVRRIVTRPRAFRVISTRSKSFVSRPRSLSSLRKLSSPPAISLFTAVKSSLPKRPVSICRRRAVRSEVLHATRKTGKVGQRPPRFNALSKLFCRR